MSYTEEGRSLLLAPDDPDARAEFMRDVERKRHIAEDREAARHFRSRICG